MNRKTWLTIKLILLVFIFLILCSIANYFLLSQWPSAGRESFGFRRAQRTALVRGVGQTFEDVGKIVVESTSMPVSIYESDVDQVTVRDNSKTLGLKLKTPNSVIFEDGILSVRQGKQITPFSILIGNFEIEIPRGSALEYDIKNGSGSVLHDAPSSEELKIKSVSGSIRVVQGGEKVHVQSVSGSIRLYAPFEEVKAKSASGSVRALADGLSRQMHCLSTSGSIKIQLNQVSGYEMKYSTVSGSVKDMYAGISYSKSGNSVSGDKTLKIEASSVSGSIKLTNWE